MGDRSRQPTIDNGIGPVYQRGTIRLTPKATTTYTLTMGGGCQTLGDGHGRRHDAGGGRCARLRRRRRRPMARIDGKPDFSGIYGFTGMSGFVAAAVRAARRRPRHRHRRSPICRRVRR